MNIISHVSHNEGEQITSFHCTNKKKESNISKKYDRKILELL